MLVFGLHVVELRAYPTGHEPGTVVAATILAATDTVDAGTLHVLPERVPPDGQLYDFPAGLMVELDCPRHIMPPLYENGLPNGQ